MAGRRRTFTAIGTLFFGILIAYVSAPRMIAYGAMQGGDSVFFDLGRGKEVSPQKLSVAISGRQASLRWFESGRTHLEIAAMYLVLSDNPKFTADLRKSFLTKSLVAFRKGLFLTPRKPYSWVQFAQAHFRANRSSPVVNDLLEMSYITAPQEPKIIVTRVQLGFRAQRILAPRLRPKFREDIRLNLKHQPRQLTIFARKQFGLPWLLDIAKKDPKLVQELYRQFLRLPPPGDL